MLTVYVFAKSILRCDTLYRGFTCNAEKKCCNREVALKPNLQLSLVLSMYLAGKSKPKSPGRHLDIYFPGRVTLKLTYVVPSTSFYCGCSCIGIIPVDMLLTI